MAKNKRYTVYYYGNLATVKDHKLQRLYVIIERDLDYELAIYRFAHDMPEYIERWSKEETLLKIQREWSPRHLMALVRHFPVEELNA